MRETFFAGVIEGFYGRPWSFEQRHRLLRWLSSWGLNTYIYAPKDDLRHRLLWQEDYSAREMAAFEELIAAARKEGIRFVYALAPGWTSVYGDAGGRAALEAKALQLVRGGCNDFALLFDDLEAERLSGFGDSPAACQSAAANEFYRFLRGKCPEAELFFCPTEYCGRMAGGVPLRSAYLRELGEKLEAGIHVFWTGPEIISEAVPVESVREVAAVLGRAPVLWDNLHANDYDLRRIYLGPYAGRPLELRSVLGGILINPNCEFELNFMAIRTLSFYLGSGGKWDARQAYEKALEEWLPRWRTVAVGDITIDELRLFGDCFYLPFEFGAGAAEMLRQIEFLLGNRPEAWGAARAQFTARMGQFKAMAGKVAALEDRELLFSCYRLGWELREELTLIERYVAWLETGGGAGSRFTSPEHRPRVCRGGFTAALQRLLPMRESGEFAACVGIP